MRRRKRRNPQAVGWSKLRGSFGHRALAAGATTAPAVAYVYGLYTPTWYEIRKASCDTGLHQNDLQELVDAMRAGYVPGTALALAVGVAASLIGRSFLPLLVAGGTAATLIGLHESAVPPGQRLGPFAALGAGAEALRANLEHAAPRQTPNGAPAPALIPGSQPTENARGGI